eukprot:3955772-Amphidinium_carterae.1
MSSTKSEQRTPGLLGHMLRRCNTSQRPPCVSWDYLITLTTIVTLVELQAVQSTPPSCCQLQLLLQPKAPGIRYLPVAPCFRGGGNANTTQDPRTHDSEELSRAQEPSFQG